MRSIGCAMVVAFVVTAAAASDDPTTPVAKAYEIDVGDVAVTKGRMPWEEPSREALFSERLAALFARDERYGGESHSVGLLAFDPFLGRQCCGMSDLKLRIVSRAEDRAVVEAKFQGSGPQSAEFDTVLERGAWRIDDIKEPDSDKKGAPVSIAEILKGAHPCGSDAARPCDWPPPPSPPSATVASPKTAPADLVRAMYKIAFKGAAETDASAKGYGDPGFRASYFTAALRRAADGIDGIRAQIPRRDPRLGSGLIDERLCRRHKFCGARDEVGRQDRRGRRLFRQGQGSRRCRLPFRQRWRRLAR